MDEHVNVGKAKPKHIHVSSLMPGCGQRLYSTFLKQFAEIKYNMCLEEQKINDERRDSNPRSPAIATTQLQSTRSATKLRKLMPPIR